MPSQIDFASIRSNWASIYGSSNHNVGIGSMRGITVYDSNGFQYTVPSTNLGIGYFIGAYASDPTGGQGSGSGQTNGNGAGDGPGGLM